MRHKIADIPARPEPMVLIWTGIGVFAAAVVLIYAVSKTMVAMMESSLAQVVIVVVGIFALFLAVAGIALALRRYGLSRHDHALALPKGSVRAILALGLLLIFVSLAVLLYNSVSRLQPKPIETEAPIKAVDKSTLPDGIFAVELEPVEGKTFWKLYSVRTETIATDLAKQIFTTVATVLVTVIGFYFGNRAAVSAGAEDAAGIERASAAARARSAAGEADKAFKEAKGNARRAEMTLEKIMALKEKVSGLVRAAIEKEIPTLNSRLKRASEEAAVAEKAAEAAKSISETVIAEADAQKADAQAIKVEEQARAAVKAALAAAGCVDFLEKALKRFSHRT